MIGIKEEECKVHDLANFKEDTFAEQPLVVLVVATHYEGDPTDNAKDFYKYIRKLNKEKSKPFEGMRYAVMGLGDTSYEMYNEMGKFFDSSFEKLGAKRLHDLGEANAETFTTEDDFAQWKENLWTKLFDEYQGMSTEAEIKEAAEKKAMEVAARKPFDDTQLPFLCVDESPDTKISGEPSYDMNSKNFLKSVHVAVDSVKELRQDNKFGCTLEVKYNLKSTGLKYKTAANFAIYPENDQAYVEAFASKIGVDLNQKFQLTSNPDFSGRSAQLPLPIGTKAITVRELLTTYIDLTGALTKKSLKELAAFAESAEEKTTLQNAGKMGSKSYDADFIQKNVGLLDLPDMFPSIQWSLSMLVNKCQNIMPRYYTIASSSMVAPEELTIIISLDEFESPNGKRLGLTSAYLKNLTAEKSEMWGMIKHRCFVKGSNFDLVDDPTVPIMMVGPGTGLAPHLGFCQERTKLQAEGAALGDAFLYFGCRHEDSDFIYREEMAQWADKKVISNLQVAISRPSKEGQQK